jgi:hypothetical protein
MSKLNTNLTARFTLGIKRFQPILSSAKARDVNESDTVIIITDMLCYIFGYDKYSEITSEHVIRGTYCDLALKINGQVEILIEAKAIGLDLKDSYVKQAVDYAANKGIDWVILTNGISWKAYKVSFGKPIEQELVIDIDFMLLSHKNSQDIECLFCLSKEGLVKSAIEAYHEQKQALNRFVLGAILLDEPVINVVKREIKRLSPKIKLEDEQIINVLSGEVLKREVVEGEKADEARRKINRGNKSHKKIRGIEIKRNGNTNLPAEKSGTIMNDKNASAEN